MPVAMDQKLSQPPFLQPLPQLFQPFLQFKHVFPFGSETQSTSDGNDAAGHFVSEHVVKDVPAYFYVMAGVRILPWP